MFEGKMEKGKNSLVVPLVPVRDIVVFPHMVIPLLVGRLKSINALEEAMLHDHRILICSQKQLKIEDPRPEDIHSIGSLVEILQFLKVPDGTARILIEGLKRVRITKYLPENKFYQVQIEDIERKVQKNAQIEALMRMVTGQFEKYIDLNPRVPAEIKSTVFNIDEPDRFVDTIVSYMSLKISDKQRMLEITDAEKRLEELSHLFNSELEILVLENKIQKRVLTKIGKTQKEYYLGEQLKAIQEELGKKEKGGEIAALRKQIKEAKMPKEVEEKALKETQRLSEMFPFSPETTVLRNYLDWLINLPWSIETEDKLDIKMARVILEEDHYGLKKVKERVLEYLAVCKLVKKMKGPILCFVGPPGTGKTSVGKSIARALGRQFIRLSLGGIRDEAEIRGHRRTYIGALPGRIIQSIRRAKSKNPVFLLDEVDKMSMDFRGDPSSALLEVLDPEQNNAFSDHYLEVGFDLSKVMFITTANTLHPLPSALEDRMEVIEFPGYIEEEKLQIARRFLLPKLFKDHGLANSSLHISSGAILKIIREYTREAGVRNLEREMANICRKAAKKMVEKGNKKIEVHSSNLSHYLGVEKFRYGRKEEKADIGVATGLAWTEAGGDILTIEAVVVPGKGELILTGKLGEVMQESARAALSYIRSRTKELKLEPNFHKKQDFHIHVPEGAIPKDGPSAGIAMATALISALTKKSISPDIAMTGEITLRGRILAIGGVKTKILAAHRTGIKSVILPQDNKKDLQEIPLKVKKELQFKFVKNMDEVLKIQQLERQ